MKPHPSNKLVQDINPGIIRLLAETVQLEEEGYCSRKLYESATAVLTSIRGLQEVPVKRWLDVGGSLMTELKTRVEKWEYEIKNAKANMGIDKMFKEAGERALKLICGDIAAVAAITDLRQKGIL